MAVIDSARPPAAGNPNPLPCAFDIRCVAALLVEPDQDNGLVIVSLAAERDARLFLAPEIALDLALRLVASVNALRRPPEARP